MASTTTEQTVSGQDVNVGDEVWFANTGWVPVVGTTPNTFTVQVAASGSNVETVRPMVVAVRR